METYNLGLIPAFNLVNSQHRRLQDTQVLAMGASTFQASGLNQLPAVPFELAAIRQEGWSSQAFLNRKFTLNNLRRRLSKGEFAIVHLATHAAFQAGTPANSYIQLWDRDRLTLDQIHHLDWGSLPVELLVLSACETALGNPQAELGFAGLAYQAGVKSTLASLWQVSDRGTLALMQEFYAQLADPAVTTKTEALRRAQLAMLRGQLQIEAQPGGSPGSIFPRSETVTQRSSFDSSAPYYWAAFTLVGSPW
jgi:CHAT domain-containing protein